MKIIKTHTFCIFLLVIAILFISNLRLNAQQLQYQMLVEKSTLNVLSFIPIKEPDRSNSIASFTEMIPDFSLNNYHQLDPNTSFPPEVFTSRYRRYSTLTAVDRLNVTPGKYTTNIIAQADTLNTSKPSQITITLIKYEETTVSSSKTTGITPEEFKTLVNISFEREINTVEKFTGVVPFRIKNLNVSKDVNFINGLGTLDLTGVEGFNEASSINTEFDIYGFTQNFNIEKIDGLFKSPKYLKD